MHFVQRFMVNSLDAFIYNQRRDHCTPTSLGKQKLLKAVYSAGRMLCYACVALRQKFSFLKKLQLHVSFKSCNYWRRRLCLHRESLTAFFFFRRQGCLKVDRVCCSTKLEKSCSLQLASVRVPGTSRKVFDWANSPANR